MKTGRKHKLKRIRRYSLATGLILTSFLFLFLPVHKIVPDSFSSPFSVRASQPQTASNPSGFTTNQWPFPFFHNLSTWDPAFVKRIELSDSSAALKISELHRLISEYHTGLSVHEEERLAELIYREGVRHQYDPELILAVILTESSFYSQSKSRKGAIGLMQLLPQTALEIRSRMNDPESMLASDFSDQLLFDPHLNIQFGVRYLTYLHDRFGNLELALTAYNYGPTRVSQWLSEGQPLPTRYTEKVMAHYKKIRG
jgi:soluble lytic murein transglycosylase